MSFIRTTNANTGKREEINSAHIITVTDNGQGQPAGLLLTNGDSYEVEQSAQSIRGYIRKAQAGVGGVGVGEDDGK